MTVIRSSGDLLADRRYAYAAAALADGDAPVAADLAEQTLERAPNYAPAWAVLGRARLRLGEEIPAREALERAVALDPADGLGVRIDLARLGVVDPADAIAEAYVRALFDDYADRFERHLVEALNYRGPALLVDALDRVAPGRRFARALDLGCGTGLMGEALRSRVASLAGCDLSAAMVEKARLKNLYDELAVAELTAYLSGVPEGGADLVTAADVLIYIGDPCWVSAAAARALAPGGLFAFSVQSHDGEGFVIGPDARFAHAEPFIRERAGAQGLRVMSCEPASVRQDQGRDVPGHVFVLER
jgi:predicted TPR repeat methyltransferase